MVRRNAYTKLEKTNQKLGIGRGKGDKIFLGFQCLNYECEQFIFVKADEIADNFNIVCPKCSFEFDQDGATNFFEYELINSNSKEIIEAGDFLIYHNDYIHNAKKFKYCVLCNSIQPIENFDKHASRKSGRQSECRLCKLNYNSLKNQTRITDQHREAAQKRRLYLDITGDKKIDSKIIYERFQHKCFKCKRDLTLPDTKKHLDHTLPAYYLWPLTTENATLLCHTCNGEKTNKWPSEVYNVMQLKELSLLTGFNFELLSSNAIYNPNALAQLQLSETVDHLLIKYAAYIDEIIKVRNRILKHTTIDFFQYSKTISEKWITQANNLL